MKVASSRLARLITMANLDNLQYFKEHMPYLNEVSIGHALIADALYLGLSETIKRYHIPAARRCECVGGIRHQRHLFGLHLKHQVDKLRGAGSECRA
mgnify:CR=1 FL=1